MGDGITILNMIYIGEYLVVIGDWDAAVSITKQLWAHSSKYRVTISRRIKDEN